MTRFLLLTITMCALVCLIAAPAMAQFGQGNSSNNLFQQYDIAGAGMYPAPHYSPQLGAQSYYTYQPLYPHELTYQHNRNYFNYYNTGGYFGGNDSLNKTSVRWQSGTNHIGPLPFSKGLEGLRYRVNARLYNLDGASGQLIGNGPIRAHFQGINQSSIRAHFQGAGPLRGGCSSGTCGGGGVISDGVVGDAFVSEGACSGGGCLLHR